ncbi:choice-of-anchor L domain-containing protein [Chryseobacterium gotjawalense]|uniref:Choice-of-anchor L domain-containing protein n=1 Tax=Chryseobacterium gotjawalense TaxID=3042315 RepID=A0ABY8RDU5_9FLAO|nr:choice-of-anchor L domain-containing protein [Chryseobacterium sp. wdc7]WHF51217.1 choice-of-anchor L domain-containing protein [Chryseobacterium sp. wdc7]
MFRYRFFSSSFALLFILFSISGSAQQYITVDTSTYTPEQLVKDIFIGSQNAACITVSNVSVKGWQDYGNNPFSHGYFEKGTLPFNIEKGLILSTGGAYRAPGPNNGVLSEGDATWLGDKDLEKAVPVASPSWNATALEFDFVSLTSTGISFEYMFLSEEYQKSGCNYSDAFAFLIKEAGATTYQNIATVLNQATGNLDPVSSRTVRDNTYCSPSNAEYFGQYNLPPMVPPNMSPTIFDGQTKVLTAKADVIPGKTYHIKLVIADNTNTSHDSAVFLKAGSFVGKKDIGPDLLLATNNPICEGGTKTLDATTAGATAYQWFKDGILIPGATNPKLNITGTAANAGTYQVDITLGGCSLKGSTKIEISEQPVIVPNKVFSYCDNQLNGSVPINFSQLSPQLISNLNSAFIPKYYLNPAGTGTPLADGWLLTATTKVYLFVESTYGCPAAIGNFTLKTGNKIPLLKPDYSTPAICDDNFQGVSVNLSNDISQFTADPSLNITFYNSLAEAKLGTPGTSISTNQTLSTTKTFGIRFEGSDCPNVAEITVNIKSPKTSPMHDQPVCPGSVTTLDAGPGFDFYEWSTGVSGSSASGISVGIGNYWVDLYSNGCVYRQNVKVTAPELPQITHIDVSGSTATVYVLDGVPPYSYSLDNVNFQASNIFYNVPRGKHTVYVKDAQNCDSVAKEFLIINLINVITPNSDGHNDVLDYSDLKIKENVSIQIFDRYGNMVFSSKDKQFIWDGKSGGRALPTANYWYILNWTEPDTQLPVSYKGWILLKNRN